LGGTSASTAINAKNPGTFTMTWNGGITFTPNGVVGNGVNGYGNTGWIENTNGVGETGLGVYSSGYTNGTLTTYDMGAQTASRRTFMNIKTSGNLYGTISDDLTGIQYGYANPNSSGLVILQRKDGTDVEGYSNGTSLGNEAIVNAGKTTNNMWVMKANGVGGYSARPYNWFQVSSDLTDAKVSTLNTIITNFNTALGRL